MSIKSDIQEEQEREEQERELERLCKVLGKRLVVEPEDSWEPMRHFRD